MTKEFEAGLLEAWEKKRREAEGLLEAPLRVAVTVKGRRRMKAIVEDGIHKRRVSRKRENGWSDDAMGGED